MKESRRTAGLSLVEVIIGMVILSAVMLMSYSILFSVSSTSSKGTLSSNLEERGKKMVSYCKNQFYDARFRDPANLKLGVFDDSTQLHFQVALRQKSAGSVDFGYVGDRLDYVDVVDPVTKKTIQVADYTKWIDCSCVIRFEAELAIYEGSTATQMVVMPGTANTSGPQEWRPNSYAGGVKLAKGDPLPVLILNRDINGDGDKTDVFVKGKIWKYVMNPANQPMDGALERISDDVILAVRADGKFLGEMDGLAPAGQPKGKDWLFRYLLAEPATPTQYGNTDELGMAAQAFPGPADVAIGVTIWHGVEDDSGKGFFLRKAWDRIPFRLSNN